jgi:hypothetical protein
VITDEFLKKIPCKWLKHILLIYYIDIKYHLPHRIITTSMTYNLNLEHTYVCMYVYTYVYTYLRIYVRMYIHMYACI